MYPSNWTPPRQAIFQQRRLDIDVDVKNNARRLSRRKVTIEHHQHTSIPTPLAPTPPRTPQNPQSTHQAFPQHTDGIFDVPYHTTPHYTSLSRHQDSHTPNQHSQLAPTRLPRPALSCTPLPCIAAWQCMHGMAYSQACAARQDARNAIRHQSSLGASATSLPISTSCSRSRSSSYLPLPPYLPTYASHYSNQPTSQPKPPTNPAPDRSASRHAPHLTYLPTQASPQTDHRPQPPHHPLITQITHDGYEQSRADRNAQIAHQDRGRLPSAPWLQASKQAKRSEAERKGMGRSRDGVVGHGQVQCAPPPLVASECARETGVAGVAGAAGVVVASGAVVMWFG